MTRGPTTVVATFPPPLERNPYQSLLAAKLAAEGVTVVPMPTFRAGWLWRNRRAVSALHVHWAEPAYRHDGAGSRQARVALSWLRLGLLAGRLATARLLGYTIVWTAHQLYPHETESEAMDRVAAALIARASHALIVHDSHTAAQVGQAFPWARAKTHVIPHGSYVGVYPEGRPREVVRAELGVPEGAVVYLAFGQVRAYKSVAVLLEAFQQADVGESRLLVAGLPLSDADAALVRAAARRDPRIVPLLEFVPDDRVAELFRASDVAVLARVDGGTSGALVLALSLGLPAVAASLPTYRELTGNGRAAWLFDPPSAPTSVAAALRAAAEPDQRAAKAAAAVEQAARLDWASIASATAVLLRGQAKGLAR